MINRARELGIIRVWLAFVIFGLFVSGITAFPLLTEMRWAASFLNIPESVRPDQLTGMKHWIALVREGLEQTNLHYPFLAYGTDWLAFAHLLLAGLFIGPWRDPVKNIFVIEFGIFACLAVIPLAMIAGPLRGIPFGWRCIDCSFGLVAISPLLICRRAVTRLESATSSIDRPSNTPAVSKTHR